MDRDSARVRWRCRRGMKELDELLAGFFDARYEDLDPGGRTAFETLLSLQDPEILDLLAGRTQAENAPLDEIVQQILRRDRS